MPKAKTAYRACFMAFDGEYQTEGSFGTVAEAMAYLDDAGSRWYFYPFPFVVTEGGTVAGTPAPEWYWCWAYRRRIGTVVRVFETVYQLTKTRELEIAAYAAELSDYARGHNLGREDAI